MIMIMVMIWLWLWLWYDYDNDDDDDDGDDGDDGDDDDNYYDDECAVVYFLIPPRVSVFNPPFQFLDMSCSKSLFFLCLLRIAQVSKQATSFKELTYFIDGS